MNKNEALESALDVAALKLSTAADIESRREAWAELRALHFQRTQAQVEELERARGLRA